MPGLSLGMGLGLGGRQGGPGDHKCPSVRARLNYVELPAAQLAASKVFFEAAFGWSLTAFGPTYAATETGDVDIGLQGDATEASDAPLPVLSVDDLELALQTVTAAGGIITRSIFAYPGGRRFHVQEPSGNIFAVSQSDPE